VGEWGGAYAELCADGCEFAVKRMKSSVQRIKMLTGSCRCKGMYWFAMSTN